MTLEREQLLELRLADGIASPEERAAAAEAEVDEQELRMVRAVDLEKTGVSVGGAKCILAALLERACPSSSPL